MLAVDAHLSEEQWSNYTCLLRCSPMRGVQYTSTGRTHALYTSTVRIVRARTGSKTNSLVCR